MTVLTLIKAAMRKAGVLSSGETPEAARQAEALDALQSMLRSWASKQILVFASAKESFDLVSGKSSYSWGTGGDITTTRPHQILGAFVRDSGSTDHPVNIISEGRYRALSSKSNTGRPEYLFYHPLYPLGCIYLYSTPQNAEIMWIDSLKPFTETSSFSTAGDTIAFPPNYEEALVYNLAMRLAPEHGVAISAEVALIASSSYDALVGLNSSAQVEPIRLSLPINTRSGFDINTG